MADDSPGESLLSTAFDLDADLLVMLVMGCYGHGRAREWVLGGATRTIAGRDDFAGVVGALNLVVGAGHRAATPSRQGVMP